MDLTSAAVTPLAVGAFTVGGVLVYRGFKGLDSTSLPVTSLAMVAGSSALASYVSPYLTKMVVAEDSSKGMLLNLALSTALTWQYLALTMDMGTANNTVPIQVAAQLLGSYAGKMVHNKKASSAVLTDDVIHDLGGSAPNGEETAATVPLTYAN